MRRGTRVGQAYIALTADGSGVNDDIVDSLDDVDYDEMGDRHGKEYSEKFRSHMGGMSESFETFLRDLGKAIDTDESLTLGIRRQVNDAFTGGDLDALTEGVGRRLGIQMGSEMQPEIERAIRVSVNDSLQKLGRDSNFDMGDLIRSITSSEDGGISIIGPVMDRATAEARRSMQEQAREMVAVHSEALQENTINDREAMAERQRVWAEGFRRAEQRERESAASYQALLDGERSALERSLADRAQMEEDQARRTNRERIRYEAEFGRLLDEQESQRAREQDQRDQEWSRMEQDRDNQRFRRFDEMARRMMSNVTLDPRIDTDRINATMRRLRTDLEAQDDLRLALHADLPLRERERIQAELEGIRARIRVSLDEDSVNATLLRAQGIRDSVSGNRGRDSNLGDRIGKMFGGGSRNNAINLLGKSIGGIINLTGSLSSGITKLTGIGGESASMMSRLAVGGLATGAAFALVAAIAAVLVSVMSALLALVVAMAATITSALVAAVSVAAAGFTALAAAGGLVAVAFTSMTDAQRTLLKDAFQPLKAELTGLGQLMITQMIPYFSVWSTNLQNALSLAAPLAGVMGQAFGRAGAILTQAFSGPGFQMFLATLTTTLPSITTNLSAALGGFLNGLLGVFSVLLPYVDRFAFYLADVAERFSTWATSAQGQNSIADFFDRAVVSLQSLWNFTQSFFGWLGDILFSQEGQAAGNTIFDSLTRSFEGFRQSIADGSLEKWFSDAIDFGRDLKDMIASLSGTISALNSSGALEATGNALSSIADFISKINDVLGPLIDVLGHVLPVTLGIALTPLWALGKAIEGIGKTIEWVHGLLSHNMADPSKISPTLGRVLNGTQPGSPGFIGPTAGYTPKPGDPGFVGPVVSQNQSIMDLINSGNSALDATSTKNGGYKAPAKYYNPYVDWANSIIKNGPTVAAQIRNAMLTLNKQVAAALRSAADASNVGEVRSTLNTTLSALKTSGQQMVNSAEQALNTAAQSLANSTSASATKKALQQVKKAQDDLFAAQMNQWRINNVARKLNAQKVLSGTNVRALLDGMRVQNATLADYAYARNIVTDRLEAANKRLADAISMRDQYRTQVTDSVKAFGSLLTAQAQTVNGVAQALTAGDITKNLEDRLKRIRDFQANLRILLARGLSADAYKQLVDAGVEQGSAYATALVQGGQGSVSQVNSLTAQINNAAQGLGKEASSRLYQAGVDAAQGLVDGLESLSAKLDSAATRLGNSIANAVKRALGIHSPSRVMMSMMDYGVGDGLVKGLDNQHGKVDAAASRLSERIAVSPEVAAYAAAQGGGSGVSQNPDQRPIELTVVTPTKDPVAAGHEAINELVGRL